LRQHRSRGRGQALVEFALVIPMFLLILMALIDLGRIVYAQNTITQDAREASRVGAVGVEAASQTLGTMQAKYAAMRKAALTMSPGVPMTDASIVGESGNCSTYQDPLGTNTCFYPDGTEIGNRVIVNITVTVPILTPLVSNLIGRDSYTLTTTSIQYIQ
jgi:Flp pilus assembly protein TadG